MSLYAPHLAVDSVLVNAKMNRDLLQRELDEAGVDSGAYDFRQTGKDEVYCLERSAAGWRYYYRERRIHRDERFFATEEEACAFFLAVLLRDPTTRLRR